MLAANPNDEWFFLSRVLVAPCFNSYCSKSILNCATVRWLVRSILRFDPNSLGNLTTETQPNRYSDVIITAFCSLLCSFLVLVASRFWREDWYYRRLRAWCFFIGCCLFWFGVFGLVRWW